MTWLLAPKGGLPGTDRDRPAEGELARDSSFRPASRPALTFNGQQFNGQQFNGQQFNGQQFNGRQFNGRQFNGQQFNGQQVNGRQFNGRQVNGRRGFSGKPLNPDAIAHLDICGAAVLAGRLRS